MQKMNGVLNFEIIEEDQMTMIFFIIYLLHALHSTILFLTEGISNNLTSTKCYNGIIFCCQLYTQVAIVRNLQTSSEV